MNQDSGTNKVSHEFPPMNPLKHNEYFLKASKYGRLIALLAAMNNKENYFASYSLMGDLIPFDIQEDINELSYIECPECGELAWNVEYTICEECNFVD